MKITESHRKILFSQAPIIWLQPCRLAEVSVFQHYKCPVYKTSDRRGVLSTTGHSSNFIIEMRIPSDMPERHWIERGTSSLSHCSASLYIYIYDALNIEYLTTIVCAILAPSSPLSSLRRCIAMLS